MTDVNDDLSSEFKQMGLESKPEPQPEPIEPQIASFYGIIEKKPQTNLQSCKNSSNQPSKEKEKKMRVIKKH